MQLAPIEHECDGGEGSPYTGDSFQDLLSHRTNPHSHSHTNASDKGYTSESNLAEIGGSGGGIGTGLLGGVSRRGQGEKHGGELEEE
jgi:hypothetical protein